MPLADSVFPVIALLAVVCLIVTLAVQSLMRLRRLVRTPARVVPSGVQFRTLDLDLFREKCKKRFAAATDEELMAEWIREVHCGGWTSARPIYHRALHEELLRRGFDAPARRSFSGDPDA
jgi:hypothetical protein